MKQIEDEVIIQKYIHQYHIDDMFLKCPTFVLYQFEKGEVINRLCNPKDYILLLVKGRLHLSNVRYDGSVYQIHAITPFQILGDMELFQQKKKQFEIVVDEPSELLAISLMHYRQILEKDYIFLKQCLLSIGDKFDRMSLVIAENETLEQKVIYYMQEHQNTLMHMEKSANELCCSKRQLQRIVKKLCDEEKLIKIKKGTYQLR